MQSQRKFSHKLKDYLIFAGPITFVFSAVVIIPFIYGIYLTFTGWDGITNAKPFVGLANYSNVLKDDGFWSSLWLTLEYVLVSVILINLVGFALAYLVTGKIKGKNFFRAGFFTPNLIGGIVLGYIWQFVFNRALPYIGSVTGISFLEKSWLSDPTKAFWTLIIVAIWQYSGYMMLIYIAGLMGVSKDILEAGKIDGCTNRQTTRHIILPLMASSFTVCLFLSITKCFMVYDVNLSLTEGGPYGTTVMSAMHVYQKAFSNKMYGVGQAEALVLFLVIAAIAVSQAYLGKRKEVEA
jgi:raffinose/stachyose/melibiose transport system permease protein